MKIEIGKFYKNRIGEKVEAVCYGKGGDTVLLSDGHYVFTETGFGNYEWGAPTDNDLIEEWKEPEVKEPKFKVGDRVRPNKEEWLRADFSANRMVENWNQCWDHEGPAPTDGIFFVVGFSNGKVKYSNKPNGFGPLVSPKFLESAKPEITVNSRWTNIGKESKTVTVVRINDKYVTFEHDGRGTIGTDTYDVFYAAYKPYVKPPKSLVGYVGVIDDGDCQCFTRTCESEEEVRSRYTVPHYNIVAIKKIEWTEDE